MLLIKNELIVKAGCSTDKTIMFSRKCVTCAHIVLTSRFLLYQHNTLLTSDTDRNLPTICFHFIMFMAVNIYMIKLNHQSVY